MMPTRPDQFIFKYLRNAAGSKAMNVDTVPMEFAYTADADVAIQRINMHVADAGMSPYDEFGGLASALTIGITIKCYAADGETVLLDFLDGETWQRNSDIIALAGSDIDPDPDTGTDSNPIRWTIAKAGDSFQMKPGESIRFRINDDLSDLTEMFAMIQGVKI